MKLNSGSHPQGSEEIHLAPHSVTEPLDVVHKGETLAVPNVKKTDDNHTPPIVMLGHQLDFIRARLMNAI